MISFKILGFRIEWVGFHKDLIPLDQAVRDLLIRQRKALATKIVRKVKKCTIKEAVLYIDDIAKKSGMLIERKAMDWKWAKQDGILSDYYNEEVEEYKEEKDTFKLKPI